MLFGSNARAHVRVQTRVTRAEIASTLGLLGDHAKVLKSYWDPNFHPIWIDEFKARKIQQMRQNFVAGEGDEELE